MHPCPVRKKAWARAAAAARVARLVAQEAAVDDQIAESTLPARRLPPLLPKKMRLFADVPVVVVAVVAVGAEVAVVAASALLRVVQAGAHPPRAATSRWPVVRQERADGGSATRSRG